MAKLQDTLDKMFGQLNIAQTQLPEYFETGLNPSKRLRPPRPLAISTVRAHQNAVALFCDYLIDHRYGWVDRCVDLFGTHPTQVCHEWNTVIHTSDHEARPAVRPLSRLELQTFFDYADDLVDRARSSGRKGWQTLFRDATLFKTIYAFGLRRREAAMLDLHDFTRNPQGWEFGRFGVCNVRWGKAMRGSQPRRRAVLAVFGWTRPVLEEYVTEVRPRFDVADESILWPTERQSRIRLDHIDDRFADWRDDLGLDPVLHSGLITEDDFIYSNSHLPYSLTV